MVAKWRGFPLSGGTPSIELVKLSGDDLLQEWRRLNLIDWAPGDRVWYRTLYREFMQDRRVFEIGAGLGSDGVYFLGKGAHWTFADISESGLEVIRRVCAEMRCHAEFVLIDPKLDNLRLLKQYDAVWANGALMGVPYDLAHAECAEIVSHLAPKARWIECIIPPERAPMDGRRIVSWDEATAAERELWHEYYDVEKIRQRIVQPDARVVLDFNLQNNALKWVDLEL